MSVKTVPQAGSGGAEGSFFSTWRERIRDLLMGPAFETVLLWAASFAAGMLASRAIVFGKYAPFGVALVAAAPKRGLPAAVIGSLIGYVLPSPVYVPIRYISAVLAAACLRWALGDLKRLSASAAFAPLITFLPLVFTGMTAGLIANAFMSTLSMYAAESLLSAGVSYFLQRASSLFTNRRGISTLGTRDIASVAVFLSVAALALNSVTILELSPGRIFIVWMVLLAARLGGVAGGAVAGIAAGMLLGFSDTGISPLSGAYGLGGLMAGAFSPLGKVGAACAFFLSCTVGSLRVGSLNSVLYGMIESAIGGAIFIVVPISRRLETLFVPRRDGLAAAGLRRSAVMKLDYAADALRSVHETVDEIAQKMEAVCAPDVHEVYRRACAEVCAGCGLHTYCWEKNKSRTDDVFTGLTPVLREKGKVENSDFGDYFVEHCGRTGELREAVNARYGEFLSRETAQLRATEVKNAVEEQFATTSALLADLAQELSLHEQFDTEAAERVDEVLRSYGVVPVQVCCRIDRFGRMTVEAETSRAYKVRLNRAALTQDLSRACGRNFAQPSVSASQNRCLFQLSERPLYHVECGSARHICGHGNLCGDCTDGFYDGCGRYIAVISDGMGTGGRAAVDGAMAAGMMKTLLQAGIGFACAAKVVNAALMAKSGDESLATLDVLCIDLFTGEAQVYKAGAPATFFCSEKEVVVTQLPSLPVGILHEVEFPGVSQPMQAGDFAVMVSDGVTASGTGWLTDFLEGWHGHDAAKLADEIVERAERERRDGHDDDITVYTVFLK